MTRQQYQRKQLDYLHARANLVEIDLVRQGGHVLLAPLEDIPESMRKDYLICVFRAILPEQIELYRAPLDSPLPNVPIPLRPAEADVVLQLQPLIDACYHDGRYHRLNYQVDPSPALDQERNEWLDRRLREEGRRASP